MSETKLKRKYTKSARVYDHCYLVIGLYESNGQRFAERVWAATPTVAEQLIAETYPDVVVVAVIDRRRRIVA